MELIVAVYDDWGIGCCGTQPIALSADRKFFRETTRGAMVIAGRKTIGDFPGKKPLPGRVNVALTRTEKEIPGFTVCASPEEAVELAKTADRAMVIGGGSVYRQMLPYCDTAYITKVHVTPESDTWFPNLDEDPAWKLSEVLLQGEENGISYEMCLYERV
jgi:dihydrofolate reductase